MILPQLYIKPFNWENNQREQILIGINLSHSKNGNNLGNKILLIEIAWEIWKALEIKTIKNRNSLKNNQKYSKKSKHKKRSISKSIVKWSLEWNQ